MTPDEAMIYSYIESSGREGIWSRTIKTKTNFHQSIMTRSIKSLESKNFIKSIKSVKWPTRIIYMLAHLTPSEDVTGGPWFTDGELDTDFVEILCVQVEKYILSRSFHVAGTSINPSKRVKGKVAKPQAEEARRRELGGTQKPLVDRNTKLQSFSPGYNKYPTLPEIVTWLNGTGMSEVQLEEEHVRQLCDILYYDRKIERVLGGTAFKAMRPSPTEDEDGPRNGLSEAPCGRCPVFSLCEEDGPVSAANCEYFKDWLDL